MPSHESCIDDSPLIQLDEEVQTALKRAPCCYLATSSGDVPNVVPAAFMWVEGDVLLLADIFFGKTRANISENPHIALTVSTIRPKCGFQIKGIATLEKEGRMFDLVVEHLADLRVVAKPYAAVVIRPHSVFRLTPGQDAGERIA